jgi:hypothetical protein
LFERVQCGAVWAVVCWVPDPDNPETEAVLIDRARRLHPDQTIGDPYPSRFRAASSGV